MTIANVRDVLYAVAELTSIPVHIITSEDQRKEAIAARAIAISVYRAATGASHRRIAIKFGQHHSCVTPLIKMVMKDDGLRAMADKILQSISPGFELFPETGRTFKTDSIYRNVLRMFSDWCAGRGLTAMPATPETVAAWLVDGGWKPGTVRSRISALATLHRDAGHEFDTHHHALIAILNK